MNFEDIDIETLRLIDGDCLVEIHSWTEDEISFNGGTLKLVNSLKGMTDSGSIGDMNSLVNSMKKSNYKDKKAMSEYVRMAGEQKREVDPNKEDIRATQAVRRGVLVKKPEKGSTTKNWDFSCEFDGEPGDEVWFDSTYTRNFITEGDGGFEKDGKRYVLVPSECIYAAKRNGEIKSMNGYIIGKVLPNDRKAGSIFLLDSETERVQVEVPPAKMPKYVADDVWTNTEVKKGDVVCIKKHFSVKLDSTMAESIDYVRFQPRVILAIEE
jgi:hypothetical protein